MTNVKNSIRKLLLLKPVWAIIEFVFAFFEQVYSKLLVSRDYEKYRKTPLPDSPAVKKAKQIEAKCFSLFTDLAVLNGPFTGMKYPEKRSVGSEFFPKLLGSYESELTGVISSIIKKPYTSIVDVGCAEGYYAIGLGMRCQNAKIYAFDTDTVALELCKKMGELNKVEIELGNFCDKEKLLNLALGEKALIVVDCEGYEVELIDKEVADTFKPHDFLVECHDLSSLGITETLLAAFADSHNIKVIESVSDIVKAYQYEYPELDTFNLEERFELLREKRSDIMFWIYAESKI